MSVRIDSEQCGKIENCPGQGLCIKLCEKGALLEEAGQIRLVEEKCDDCNICIQSCPNQAITSNQ
jgi:MinD superfamily P-loop ATPase